MSSFIFNKNDISQHVVKYGVDVRPSLVAEDRQKLQEYCNYLIEKHPQAFETLLSGREKTLIQKVFFAGNNKRIELPTFSTTDRGFCYTFPVQLFIGNVEEFDIPDKVKIFRDALKQFRKNFAGRKIVRVGVVNEIIFDCGSMNSVEVIADVLSKDLWKERINNIAIHLENPTDEYNINVDLAPTYAQQVVQSPAGEIKPPIGFGVSIKLDINNRDMTKDLEDEEIAAILTFSDDFVPEELLKFLNNERS
jgi:hypothetical protein